MTAESSPLARDRSAGVQSNSMSSTSSQWGLSIDNFHNILTS